MHRHEQEQMEMPVPSSGGWPTVNADHFEGRSCKRGLRIRRSSNTAFSLIELMVVIAIIAILAALLLPALSRAKEKAKVAKAHLELAGIGLALQMYADDHEGLLPPVRVNCNSDLSEHWCQLPIELASERYLPRSGQGGREANMEDPFDPGHTYKYAAPGPQLLNGEPSGLYALWIPSGFPDLSGNSGKYHTDPKTSPVRWALWSLGPRPKSKKSQSTYAPMSSDTWYRRVGDSGVIVRYATREGIQFKSP
jgi:prepilin-type N-terminal cleavage/methylation domain-containing protein